MIRVFASRPAVQQHLRFLSPNDNRSINGKGTVARSVPVKNHMTFAAMDEVNLRVQEAIRKHWPKDLTYFDREPPLGTADVVEHLVPFIKAEVVTPALLEEMATSSFRDGGTFAAKAFVAAMDIRRGNQAKMERSELNTTIMTLFQKEMQSSLLTGEPTPKLTNEAIAAFTRLYELAKFQQSVNGDPELGLQIQISPEKFMSFVTGKAPADWQIPQAKFIQEVFDVEKK